MLTNMKHSYYSGCCNKRVTADCVNIHGMYGATLYYDRNLSTVWYVPIYLVMLLEIELVSKDLEGDMS